VQGTYRNGVLELHIPRVAEAQPRRIPIQGQQAGSGERPQVTSGQAAKTEAKAQQEKTTSGEGKK
jgi:hypothetical protein